MAVEELNLLQKLAKIRKQVEVLKKNKSGFNYKYVTDEEILARVTVFMDKYNISLIPSIVEGSSWHEKYEYFKTKIDKTTKQPYDERNNEVIVGADMVYTWVNNNNPDEKIRVPWMFIGQQSDSSQAFGSGLTYSMRYFLLKYFNIATPEDDVDNWRSKQRMAEVEEDKKIARQIVEQIDQYVKAYLGNKPDEAEKVKTFLKKYVKGSNYFNITDSVLAQKLLSDFEMTFLKEEN